MDASISRTILSLNDDKTRLELEKRQALLAQAEMAHELKLLRHMRAEITGVLLERRRNTASDHGTRHTLSRISRILRNEKQTH